MTTKFVSFTLSIIIPSGLAHIFAVTALYCVKNDEDFSGLVVRDLSVFFVWRYSFLILVTNRRRELFFKNGGTLSISVPIEEVFHVPETHVWRTCDAHLKNINGFKWCNRFTCEFNGSIVCAKGFVRWTIPWIFQALFAWRVQSVVDGYSVVYLLDSAHSCFSHYVAIEDWIVVLGNEISCVAKWTRKIKSLVLLRLL